MGILELLSQLINLIREVLWPFYIVRDPDRAVRYTFGVPGVKWRVWWGFREAVLGPGWYFCVPWAQDIQLTNCAEDTIDIANISGTSRDGVQFTASFNIRLKVYDPLKYQINLRQEIDPKKADTMPSAIHAECLTSVAAMLRNRKWESIYRSQGKIGSKLTKSLKASLDNWGIMVIAGGVTTCSQAVPIALINVD